MSLNGMMLNQNESYNSYLVRFWRAEMGGEPKSGWQGEVESIQTGQKSQFTSLDSLYDFLQRDLQVIFVPLADDVSGED